MVFSLAARARWRASFQALACVCALFVASAHAQSGYVHTDALQSAPTHQRFIVQYKEDAGVTTTAIAQERLGARLSGGPSPHQSDILLPGNPQHASPTVVREMAPGGYVVRSSVPLDAVAAERWMRAIADDPKVKYVQADELHEARRAFNDTWYSYQDNLHGAYGIAADQAWAMTSAKGVYVAVIDTGFVAHPDLDAAMLPGYNFVNFNTNPYETACTVSHGTKVAGAVAALGNNARGIAGAAMSRIVPIKVAPGCDDSGHWASDTMSAIRWAVGQQIGPTTVNANPVEVINVSRGANRACSPAYQDAIDYAVTAGATVIVSAGNDDIPVEEDSPANCRNVIAVGAVDEHGRRSSFSNHGAGIDIAAPGYLQWPSQDDRTIKYVQGTSYGSPLVAGVVALMQAVANPALSPARVEELLKISARAFPSTPDKAVGPGIAYAPAAVSLAMAEKKAGLRGAFVMVPQDKNGCLIISNNGLDERPSYHRWPDVPAGGAETCGLGDPQTLIQNRQAVWHLEPVTSSKGITAHIVRSHVNEKCLIRGHSGHAEAASLYLWGEVADKTFCGWPSADALIENGQAAWFLDEPQETIEGGKKRVHAGLKVLRPNFGYLFFEDDASPGENRILDGTQRKFDFHQLPPVDDAGVPAEGVPFRAVSNWNNECVDAEKGMTVRSPLVTYTCRTEEPQRFTFRDQRIYVGDSKTWCAEIQDGHHTLDAPIVVGRCSNLDSQLWAIDVTGRIRSRMADNLCMMVSAGASPRIVTWDCDAYSPTERRLFKFLAPL